MQRGADIDGDASLDESGFSVSLSDDGTIVAIGAIGNDGAGSFAGHVRVYQYDADKDAEVTDQTASDFGPIGWNRLGDDIDGDGEATDDYNGYSVSLSSNGSIVAIGQPTLDARNGARVFALDNGAWVQRGGHIVGEAINDKSGTSVSLSSDGSIVAIGSIYNDGSTDNAGHVRVYKYDSGSPAENDQSSPDFGPVKWRRLGADIDGEPIISDYSGWSVSLSSDGSIVAIGARYNDGSFTSAGHVRVYEYKTITEDEYDEGNTDDTLGVVGVPIIIDGGVSWGASTKFWVQQGDDIDGEAHSELSGWSVSLNDNGRTVAIGAPYADSNGMSSNGSVRVYRISSPSNKVPQVGDWAVAEHKETDTGADLSTYTYRVTHVTDADTLVLKFVSSSNNADISQGIYDGKSLGVAEQEIYPGGMAFSSDGSKAYILGSQNDTVYQYTLATPWDISTGEYANKSLSVGGIGDNIGPLTFSSDGTEVYILVMSMSRIYQFTLNTPWDISTTYGIVRQILTMPQEGIPTGLKFSPDGTKAYIVGYASDTIYQYTLTTPWNISTGSYASKSLSVASQENSPFGLAFSPDGTEVYVVGQQANKVHQYDLTVAWDISTGSYANKSLTITGSSGGVDNVKPTELTLSSDGTKMYITTAYKVVGSQLISHAYVFQYTIPEAYPDLSPCDLCDGTGPPGDCPIAPHVIKRDLGGMFMMLLD